MAQNKLETQIKEQLNAREIKPTEMAWDRLDAMLSVAEEKKDKKGFAWMYVAAVFIGFILVGFVLFQLNSNEIHIENSVVNQDNETKVETETQNEMVNPNSENGSQSTQVAEVTSVENKKTIINNNNNHQSNQSSVKNQNPITEEKTLIANNVSKDILFEEPKLKVTPINVSADKLLASVETSKKDKQKASVNVNAQSMLAQSEADQNPNFRETSLQKLKRNFKTVKIAVANRNDQE